LHFRAGSVSIGNRFGVAAISAIEATEPSLPWMFVLDSQISASRRAPIAAAVNRQASSCLTTFSMGEPL
jgi:hypothetical protein